MKVEQRRRLTDLYSRGESVTLGEGDAAVTVWVRKMTPGDAEAAYSRANARRASLLAEEKREEPSPYYTALRDGVSTLGKQMLVNWLVSRDLVERRPVVEAQLADEDEWKEEGYLTSLQERLADETFQKKIEEFPDDEEVKRVTAEISRFRTEADARVEIARQDLIHEYEEKSEEELRQDVVSGSLKAAADAAWVQEFNLCQIWKCVMDEDKTPMFDKREEVDDLQAQTVGELIDAINRVHVPDAEGKG